MKFVQVLLYAIYRMSPLSSPQAQQISPVFAADAEVICYTGGVFRTRKKEHPVHF